MRCELFFFILLCGMAAIVCRAPPQTILTHTHAYMHTTPQNPIQTHTYICPHSPICPDSQTPFTSSVACSYSSTHPRAVPLAPPPRGGGLRPCQALRHTAAGVGHDGPQDLCGPPRHPDAGQRLVLELPVWRPYDGGGGDALEAPLGGQGTPLAVDQPPARVSEQAE